MTRFAPWPPNAGPHGGRRSPPCWRTAGPKDVFIADGLHMTPAGYELGAQVVRPVLEHEARTGAAC